MATDIMFPLYDVLVNNIFGSVGLSIVIMGIVLAVILMITRTSKEFIVYWMIFYTATMFTMFFGVLAIFLALIFGILYLGKNIMNFQSGGTT